MADPPIVNCTAHLDTGARATPFEPDQIVDLPWWDAARRFHVQFELGYAAEVFLLNDSCLLRIYFWKKEYDARDDGYLVDLRCSGRTWPLLCERAQARGVTWAALERIAQRATELGIRLPQKEGP